MSPRPPSHGEFVTLKEYVESRIEAVEKGIEVANAVMQDRLAGMNEFRDTLKDQASRFITREEVDIKLKSIEDRVQELQLSKAAMDGKASQTHANIIMVIAIIGLVISFISLFLK
jgi:hypothetical protein